MSKKAYTRQYYIEAADQSFKVRKVYTRELGKLRKELGEDISVGHYKSLYVVTHNNSDFPMMYLGKDYVSPTRKSPVPEVVGWYRNGQMNSYAWSSIPDALKGMVMHAYFQATLNTKAVGEE